MNLNCKNTFDVPISNPQNSLLFLEETLHTFGSPVPFRIILGFDLLVVPMTVEDGVIYVETILRDSNLGNRHGLGLILRVWPVGDVHIHGLGLILRVEDGVTYVEIILRVKRVGDFGEMIVIVLRSKINLDNLICGESDDWLTTGGPAHFEVYSWIE